jgi:diadenosine tetraphosphate (Ap4A) HIT family hydrolase
VILKEETQGCSLCILAEGKGSPIWRDLFPHDSSNDILWEGTTVAVVLDTAPLVKGHLLIMSRAHRLSFYQVASESPDEFDRVVEDVSRIFAQKYQPPTFFEHGSSDGTARAGACVDHAHLHVIPGYYNLVPRIRLDFPDLIEYSTLSEALSAQQGKPYLLVAEPGQKVYATEAKICPNQYLRSVVSQAVGAADRWHWQDCLLFSDMWGIPEDIQTARSELYPAFTSLSK